MNTVHFVSSSDRGATSNLSAVSAGIGTQRSRVASTTMVSQKDGPGPWKQQPTPIATPARQAASAPRHSAALNPYGGARMSTTLTNQRKSGAGNNTSSQTVLGDSRGVRRPQFRIPANQPTKRQRVDDNMKSSKFWPEGVMAKGRLQPMLATVLLRLSLRSSRIARIWAWVIPARPRPGRDERRSLRLTRLTASSRKITSRPYRHVNGHERRLTISRRLRMTSREDDYHETG
ncbi:hypothetical protein C8Q70DRAFT_638225 [Cubamyces menziesii]|nr:hypothetical protein C8Q70DRAFT_638225 [Cubamyces menziesii]